MLLKKKKGTWPKNRKIESKKYRKPYIRQKLRKSWCSIHT
jgi:hypothetical protein